MKSLLKVLGQSKRLTSIAAFGAAGMLLTATWAAGVASSPAANTTAANSSPVVAGAPAGADDRFADAIAIGEDTGLTIDFDGLWGVLPEDTFAGDDPSADYELFDVDLAGLDDGTYFVEVGLLPTTPASPDGFIALQINWVIAPAACVDATTTDSLATRAGTAANVKTLYADNLDNSVVFPNLEENTQHCIGVLSSGTATDTAGTFIRRAESGVTFDGELPSFVAIVNQHT
ncbi:MAG: hypothetical protein WEC34_10890 [Acidimicrobiia bacterium]